MSLRDDIARILSSYLRAKTDHEAMNEIKETFRSLQGELQNLEIIEKRGNIRVTFGTGFGRVANVPWVAFLDRRETETTQRGIYCVFLFKADMSGVYLTFNQGVGIGRIGFKGSTHDQLEYVQKVAVDLRKELSALLAYGFFADANIDLADKGATGKAYEKATIAYKYYDRYQIPSDDEIKKDLEVLLDAYEKYVGEHPRLPETVPREAPTDKRIGDVDIPSLVKLIDFLKAKYEFYALKPPEMKKVKDIISYAENEWQLPNFQRYFDWNKEDVKAFIESVFNDYYVGSFLLWEKKRDAEPDLELINVDGMTKFIENPTSIILDGQQRITSLYWVIKGPKVGSKPEKVPNAFFYINFKSFFANIEGEQIEKEKGEFIECLNTKYEQEETYRKMLFPLYELENYGDWVDGFEDYLCTKKDRISDDVIRSMRRIMEKRLRHMWEGFDIPCVFLPASMKLKQVADIFERLNTKGKTLGIFDLLMARLLKYGIPLRKYWNKCRESYADTIKRYYKESEKIPVYIVQSMSLYYDKSAHSCRREDILDIYDRIYKNPSFSFEEHWKEFADYVDRAIRMIENPVSGYGARDQKEVPFIPMIPIMAALLKEIDSRPDSKYRCIEKMDIWYWASVFSNAYSSAVDSTLSAHYRDLLSWFDDESQIPSVVRDARREIDSMDFTEVRVHGNAMYKGILSLLVLEHAKDFAEKKEIGHAPVYHKHHIFPRGVREFGPLHLVDSVLNMTWLTDATNQRIIKARKPSIYLKELLMDKYGGDEEELLRVLQSHFIDRTVYEFMLKDGEGFEQFLSHRQELIKGKIREKLGIKDLGGQTALIKPGDSWENRMAYEDAISSCEGTINWFDRWFSDPGLKFLTRAVNSAKVRKIRILTAIYSHADKSALDIFKELRDSFKDFQSFMKDKGIVAELRVLAPSLKSVSHDRWIFSDTKNYRLPSPDTVERGQYSEISQTQIRLPFDEWWDLSKDIINDWNAVRDMAEKYDQTKKS